ncbi:MAG: C40 family peptidase, partial [Christensenellales bacterium]
LKERLIELRYLKSSTTGYFGTDTETAVKNFQKRNGLTVDGNVGAQTREVLYSEDAKAAPKPSVSSSGGSSSDPSGKGSGGGGSIAKGNPDKASADALIEFALSLKGSRYVLGAKGPNSFDCSGFVYYCLNRVGYSIRYMTSGGWAKCSLPKVTSMQDMKRGDIICFRGHVGIYMGNGKMVDASSSSGQIVTRNNIFSSSYWTRNFICARRVF